MRWAGICGRRRQRVPGRAWSVLRHLPLPSQQRHRAEVDVEPRLCISSPVYRQSVTSRLGNVTVQRPSQIIPGGHACRHQRNFLWLFAFS